MTGRRRPGGDDDPTVERAAPPRHPSRQAERSPRVEPDADRVPRPEWIPTDDVIGPCPDRQVLVVGTTPTGLALTLLLRAAGYDPVVVSGTDRPAASRITFLSPAALGVLSALNVGCRVLDAGQRVVGVTVRWTGDAGEQRETRAGTADSDALPVVIPTPLLRRTLEAAFPGFATTRGRAVDSAAPRDGGVEVVFDDGVREWFDVVVDAGSGGDPLRPTGWNRTDSLLRQYEASVGGDSRGARIREVWRPYGVVQRIPTPTDARHLVRITTPESDRSARDPGAMDERTRADAAEIPDSGAFDQRRVRQVMLPDGAPHTRWWGSGRIARCGPAACPAVPATGVGVSLGITDALGFVSALARDGTPVPETVDAYAAGRSRRFAAVRRNATAADRAVPTPEEPDGPLGSLRALRAVALEPFFGTAPPALGDPTPK